MPANQWVMLLAFLYFGVLFFIAWWADRRAEWPRRFRPLIYSLSLAVYCSSWTFFGAVGEAVESGWGFLPIYLGPILLFVVGWPFLRRLSVMSTRNRVTSIADFMGSRYGKNQLLAALVTFLAVLGSLPYIALQLKAITQAWTSVKHLWDQRAEDVGSQSFTGEMFGTVSFVDPGSTSFIAALILVLFTVAFGTRVVEKRQRHRGLMAAVAIESIVKLAAFVMVGVFALGLLWSSDSAPLHWGHFSQLPDLTNFFTQMLLAVAAIVCLPRQFHVMVVEHHSRRDMRLARWIFPLYLLAFCAMIAPIAIAGMSLLPSVGTADMLVVSLPLHMGNNQLAVIALLGGMSAATGMVIVACVTLSVMVCNEWLVPLWQRFRQGHEINARWLQQVRRIAIAAVLFAAWLLEQQLSAHGGLASLGLLSFAAAAQLLPGIIGALYWNRGHAKGVVVGLLAGGFLWAYTLLLPAVLGQGHSVVSSGPMGWQWLRPEALMGFDFGDALSHGVFWSLAVNSLLMVLISRRCRFSSIDMRQARSFTEVRVERRQLQAELELTDIDAWQLHRLLVPLLGDGRSERMWQRFEQRLGHRLLPSDRVPRFVIKDVEESLASIVGAVSAHRTLELLAKRKPLDIDEFVSLIGTTSRQIQFGQDLLQITLETIPQGVSVVDGNLNLVAWNQRYVDLFNFPERLLYVGCPIAKIYQYNAERGYLHDADSDVDAAIRRRLGLLQGAKPYRLERLLPNGLVIEICGTPMANGGYVTTYTDISEYRRIFNELEAAKSQLEERVAARTSELETVNQSLEEENATRARIERELNTVYASKNRFLASASHDLLQPINAARLFTAALSGKVEEQAAGASSLSRDVKHIDEALAGAETLITSLREIARLDSGRMQPQLESFAIQSLLDTMGREFSVIAQRSGLTLRVAPCSLWVRSDRHLLRRVVQNLLSNALRYTPQGTVLLGCRRQGEQLSIQVLDTGPGIAEQDQQRIFDEFERANDAAHRETEAGLGLGLSIVRRISSLLGHDLRMVSVPGRGTVFSITVPIVNAVAASEAATVAEEALQSELAGLTVLCVDNEAAIRAGMQSLLAQWQCRVFAGASLSDVLSQWPLDTPPDIVLADYHLDGGETGLELLQTLSYHWGKSLPAIVISADNSDAVRRSVIDAGYRFLAKPVKPAALRGLMRKMARGLG